MILGSVVIKGMSHDQIFNLSGKYNRDNGLLSWVLLRDLFLSKNIGIHTRDLNSGKKTEFEIHMDVSDVTLGKSYLLMLETPQVVPANGISAGLAKYRKIFTWDDGLVDGLNFIKINFPNKIKINPLDGFSNRERFCCLISSNRALPSKDDRILYSERVKAVRWFEHNAPQDFDLYGVGWDLPAAKGNLIGKIEHRVYKILSKMHHSKPFPSYRGQVVFKNEVLSNTRFSICYENVRDLPGYITEKIFDCFFSGCVPVYWGASNIQDYIPRDCFIDRRQFDAMSELYAFMKAMTESDFIGYQQRIADFLQSKAAYPFSSECFAETIVNTVVKDIGA